ncbi:MAG: fumarate reductase (CoM/CoB) subunit TfrA [Methanoculleaceae archaeon]
MHVDTCLDCHVLVIGSGGAGMRAAIEASGAGDTILVSKTLPGKGGCTIMAEGGYNAVLDPEDRIEDHIADTMQGGAYLNDPDLVERLVTEAPRRMEDLLRWGAVFDMTGDDRLAQRPFGGQRFPRTCFAGDRSGHELILTLVERIADCDVNIFPDVTVTDLLVSEGRVCGAAGLDRAGRLVTVHADATILAAGGGTRVYDISTNSAAGTGDGFAMAYRAGAELIDMEMVQFHPTGLVYPPDVRGRLVTEAVRGEGGILLNADGERFMSRYDPERMELSTRDVVARAIATEILEGRGTPNGGVYLDVSHLPAGTIEERLPTMLEQFLRFGVDIREQPMEVAPTAHHIMGGLRIDKDGRTTLPGLFACGEVAGGVHGANRLGGNALADTQVFGARAGRAAAAVTSRAPSIDDRQIDAICTRFDGYLGGSVNPAVVRDRLRAAMWEGAGIFRTEDGLKETLRTINELSAANLRAKGPENLKDCMTVANMCTTASLIVRCAMLRRESRGAHLRRDVETPWPPERSPFGHTRISRDLWEIERREEM